ncbi:TetR/AcrR family transcriptional regulator [Microbacterium resistens]|uniref:TetR/AcrR family transcriptional regulator n=1 Tax=Microbacterium resistens TaxID=156977 RepID=A0ABY3RQV3_9MICO|nr:TetR/AcrR family transcriptional regulator [Microbacterium resistens]MBW1639369.1 TetR/AcrR family transcriptional regulator [Microbacterium resistens]UGS26157.1 TetR/AcrR family transcriptional regulator [Microbacterium resistens]
MEAAAESAAPRKRRSPKGEARRQRILDVARTIFSEGGYHSASIADIAARAGISQAGLLHHFPSKPELLLAVLNSRDAEAVRQLRDRNLTGVAYLNEYLRTLWDHAADPVLVQLNAMISAEALAESHPAHDYFVEQHRVRLADFTRSIEETFDFDAMPPGVTAETVARWAIALAEGMRLQMLYEDAGKVDRSGTLALFFESLRPYLRDPEPITTPGDEPVGPR